MQYYIDRHVYSSLSAVNALHVHFDAVKALKANAIDEIDAWLKNYSDKKLNHTAYGECERNIEKLKTIGSKNMSMNILFLTILGLLVLD